MRPPPLIPWNGFDVGDDSRYAVAVRSIARMLADDEWHPTSDVITAVVSESGLKWKTVRNLIGELKAHGDVREKSRLLRLTTRWLL